MNVLLVYPRFPDTFWSYSHALWFVGKRAVSPPLGLLTVAAMLPRVWGVRLVDLNIGALTPTDLQWADCVFVSAMGVQRDSAQQVIREAKAAGKLTVAGGPLFSAEEAILEGVDHFILNEAELTFPPFLADLQAHRAKRIYRTKELANLADSPIPAWHLVNQKRYCSMPVQFSRGCPFDCDFCSVTSLLGRKPRTKPVDRMIAELDALHAAGWRGPIFFVDDNLIGHRPSVRNLLPALEQWQARSGPAPLQTQLSIDLAADPELVQSMVCAGFDTVFVGIETPDADSLAECGKRQNRGRDLAADVRTLQRAGLEVQAGFIVGFDHDTPSSFQRQVEFIQKTGIVTAMVGLLQALKGTRLYQRMKSEGRLLGDSTCDNVDGSTNIIPTMGIESLSAGYAELLRGIYSPQAYYQRVRTFLRQYRSPKTGMPIDFQNLRAFFRSTYHLGLFSRERWQYWRLLAWTITHRPALFALAVRMTIVGHHYFRICDARTFGAS